MTILSPWVTKLWAKEMMAAYRVNLTLASLGKWQCDTCSQRLAPYKFWTKTTCRACYTRARR